MEHDEQLIMSHAKLLEEIKEDLNGINKRLFHDNGIESLQSRINRIDLWAVNHDKMQDKVVAWWFWLIPIVVSFGVVIIDKVWK